MTRTRPIAAAVALAALVATTVAVTVGPQPAGAQATEPYSAEATVDLVHLDALSLTGIIDVADIALSPASAATDTAGLDDFDGANAAATATNADVDLLDGVLPLEALVSATDVAPPDDGPTADTLLSLPANPLLDLSVASVNTQSRWRGSNECVPPGTPISEAQVDVADAALLPGALADSLVALRNSEGPTVFTRSTVGLVDVEGQATKGVEAESLTQVTAVVLFEGTANQVTINVLAPPRVTATATGDAETSSVTYSEPVLQILDAGGNELATLDADTLNFTVPGLPLINLELGTLESQISPDGTLAEGQADLLRVEILSIPGVLDPLVELSVAGGFAHAEAPAGGVICPPGENFLREVHKDVSADTAVPGQTFTYSVTIPNRGDCALTDVVVTDVISGGDATIQSTDPQGTIGADGQSVSWVIDSLAPNETRVFDVTVLPEAPSGTTYTDTLTATGTDCDGNEHEGGDEIDLPTVGDTGSGGCHVGASNIAASHEEVFVGETFTYYVHLANSGGETCESITVTQDLDENVTFVDCNRDCTHPENGTPNGQVTWTIPSLGAGQSMTLWVVAEVLGGEGERLPSSVIFDPANGDSHQASTEGPLVSGNSVLAGPMPAVFVEVAATGADLPVAVWVAAAAVMVGVGLRRRRLGTAVEVGGTRRV